MGSVLVIVDPAFGEKLRTVDAGQPVWIVMSPENERIVRSLWASETAPDHLTGITGFRFVQGVSPEDMLIGELSTIDLHHGPNSSADPWTELVVIGARPTSGVQGALHEFGFDHIIETEGGFRARRTDGAVRLPDE